MNGTLVTLPSPLQNDLLAALSPGIQQRLFPLLEPCSLPLGKVLYRKGEALTHAYFPVDAIVSLLSVMRDGASAEISIVGKDGFIGIAWLLGGRTTPWTAVVQSQGSSFRLPVKVLMDEFHSNSEVMSLFLNYFQILITQMAQTAVCNRHHHLLEQLARWLLLFLDRLPNTKLDMTQEMIASMLGVRREGVTAAAGKLQKLGLISYRRGHITVLDREGLERVACECYRVVRNETERLMTNRNKIQEPVHCAMGLRQTHSV